MNPNVDESTIEAAYEADPIAAASEWGAEFRSDLESYITEEAVAGVTVHDRLELEPRTGITYQAFVDPSGGARDSFTMAVGHREKETAVLDVVRERKAPFSPEAVVADFCKTLKTYRVHKVSGDRYAAEWSVQAFQKNGIEYRPAQHTKSALYTELLPLINSKRVELLDLKVLQVQLCGLERRTGRGGKDSVDHAPGTRDDVANACAGVLVGLADRGASVAGLNFGAANDDFIGGSGFAAHHWDYVNQSDEIRGKSEGELAADWRRQSD